MDIDALHSALISLTLVPEEIRSARETLAQSKEADQRAFITFLESIERDLRVAKSMLAGELGFPLCQCCWPPELLTTNAEGETHCAAATTNKPRRAASKFPMVRREMAPPRTERFSRAQLKFPA